MYVSWQPTKPIWPFVWKNICIPIHMFMCLFLFFYFSQLICFNFIVSILLTYAHVYAYLLNLYRFLHTCMTYLFSQLICFNFTVSILLIYIHVYLLNLYRFLHTVHVWHIYIIIFYSFQLFIFCFSESNFHPTILFLFNSHFLIFTLPLFMYPIYIYI